MFKKDQTNKTQNKQTEPNHYHHQKTNKLYVHLSLCFGHSSFLLWAAMQGPGNTVSASSAVLLNC